MGGMLPPQQPGSFRDVPSLAQDSRDQGLLSCRFTALQSPCRLLLSSGTASCASTRSPDPEPSCPRMDELQLGFSLRSSTVPRQCHDGQEMPPLPCAATSMVTQEQSLLGAAQRPPSASSPPLKIPFPEEPCEAPQVFGFARMFIKNLSHD